MSPSDLYATTLTALYKTKTTLLSEEWHEELEGATKDQRIDSSLKIMDVTNAIAALSNAQLSAIAGEMSEQEDALNTAIDGLNAAQKTITNIQNVLDAVTQLITVVGQIVPLL